MSRLEKLIRELCPDGVEYKKLGEVVAFINGRAYKKSELLEQGKYKVLRVGNFFTSDKWYYSDLELDDDKYCESGDLLYAWAASLGPRIWEGEKSIFHYHIWKLKFDGQRLLKGYLYHFLLKDVSEIYNSLTHSTMPHVSMANMKERTIPVPPLVVQQEIVRMLDNFTALTAELQAELRAELQARKKQYEYYRDKLFLAYDRDELPISEIAQTNIGLATSVAKHKRVSGVRLLHNSDIKQNRIAIKTEEYISEEFAMKNAKKILRKNDIITVHTGDVGTSAVIDEKYEGAIGFTTITTRINDTRQVNPHYLCHFLNSHKCKSDIAFMTISDRSNLNQKNFEKLMIPIPSIEEQQRIVSILDRFDTLCNNLTSGLSAEIEARQKQYAYYRDKLLTFKEKA